MNNNEIKVTGRFNYSSYGKNIYNVTYNPYFGNISVTVVRGLTIEEANDLIQELNGVLDGYKPAKSED